MAESWAGQSLQALPATALGALGALGSEFLREWEAQDMRVTLFKLLLLWLVLSLLCVQLAWGFYGSTVTGLYHRPGLGGQNESTPDGSTHFPSWRQPKGLQGHHRVCWLPLWALLLPRSQG
uniref:T-cell leukemia translocation-altered gene protein homolog n=1 Tax=Pipistrellus kuhlii TaxID=59472 RepID=A0A7J7WEU9_PIPKU|nr:T cell leukemia translocation altered [Pipistrellus kuhlii]